MLQRIAGPRWTGKPLQIAVDDVTGTTKATKPAGLWAIKAAGQGTTRAGLNVTEASASPRRSRQSLP